MATEVTVKGVLYRLEPMSARKQWDVARRLAPILEVALPAILDALAKGSLSDADAAQAALPPLIRGIGSLTDEASDRLLDECLACVRRPGGGGAYVPLTRDGQFMFESDNNLLVMLTLAAHVIWDNLGSFFGELRGLYPAQPTERPGLPGSSPLQTG